MRNLLRYLLCAKHGILKTLCWTGGALAVCSLIVGLFTGMHYRIYTELEKMSIIAVVIGFAFVCSNAFRVGTANGVSRSTVIKTLLASVLIVSAAQSAVNSCMLMLRNLATQNASPMYHWSFDLLYIKFANHVGVEKAADMDALNAQVPMLILWESLLYFGIVCLLLTFCCFLFALYRKYDIAGLVGGIAAPFLLIGIFQLYIKSSDGLSQSLHDFCYHKEPVQLTQFGMYEQPKALPFIVGFSVLILIAAAGFAVCMKHTGIQKGRLTVFERSDRT